MAATFDLTDHGEQVFIRRNNRLYTIIPVVDHDLTIAPELQAKIDKARQEYLEGKALVFANAHEAQQWMDNL